MKNVEAEKAVLGCLLTDNNKINTISQSISVDDFYVELHRNIFRNIIDVYNKRGTVDIITLQGFDIEYLAGITSIGTAEGIIHYAEIVKEFSIRRQLIKKSDELKLLASRDYENISTMKADALNIINSIAIPESKRSFRIGEIMMDVMTELEKRYNEKDNSYMKWGFKWLDEATGGIKPGLKYLAARPSVGKTTFAMNVAMNVVRQGKSVAIFSLETERIQLAEKLLSSHGKINSSSLQNTWTMSETDWGKVGSFADQVSKLKLSIFDNIYSVEAIKLKCSELKAADGLDFVVIDYVQLCETSKKYSNSNERVSYISRQLKLLQMELDIPFLVLSQLNRASEKDEYPKLEHLRDSGSLEQDADDVLFLHDENSNNPPGVNDVNAPSLIKLIIAKQRTGNRNVSTVLEFYKKAQIFYGGA